MLLRESAATFPAASAVASATSSTCTKLRRCLPSSNTCGASPRLTADANSAATPAYGVFRGMPGPYTLWYLRATAVPPLARAHAAARCSCASLLSA